MTTSNIILVATTTATALITGLFYAYSVSVNPGLGQLPDDVYLRSMQSINREILNPFFFATFIGTLILLPISTWLEYSKHSSSSYMLLLAAAVIYAIGTFGVTMLGNVPLNEALDKINLSATSAEELSRQRALFEVPWNRLHGIRTFASLISLILCIIACVVQSKEILHTPR